MEEQSFNLKLTFSDSVSNKSQLQEIANNVLRAIVGECNCGLGISPSDGDTVTLKFLFSIMI